MLLLPTLLCIVWSRGVKTPLPVTLFVFFNLLFQNFLEMIKLFKPFCPQIILGTQQMLIISIFLSCNILYLNNYCHFGFLSDFFSEARGFFRATVFCLYKCTVGTIYMRETASRSNADFDTKFSFTNSTWNIKDA